jgi:hypothetical protein
MKHMVWERMALHESPRLNRMKLWIIEPMKGSGSTLKSPNITSVLNKLNKGHIISAIIPYVHIPCTRNHGFIWEELRVEMGDHDTEIYKISGQIAYRLFHYHADSR